MPLKHKTDDKT